MHVSRCGALMTVASRLAEPSRNAWWLPFAHAVIADHPGVEMDEGVRTRFMEEWPDHEPYVDHPSFEGIREDFRAAWPCYESFVKALRAIAPNGLDPNVGNVLVGLDGSPVVYDPLCDDGEGLWRSPVARLLSRCGETLRGLTGEGWRRARAAA